MHPSSILDPAGSDAERIALLFWWMTAMVILVWVSVVALTIYCVRRDVDAGSERRGRTLIVVGGVVVPALVLGALLILGLPELRASASPPASPRFMIAVSGEQWWWRVRYLPVGAPPIDLANEIRLPVGERVEVVLNSTDVIHSFWIPALAGKIDMIPGRTTRLFLEPTRTGVFRGTCAEYCGASHALMAFPVVVLEREAFDDWLTAESRPVVMAATAGARRGGELFLENGCGACHAIRGTSADGRIGPDLTHVGGRSSLAAGTLPNDVASVAEWVTDPSRLKPGAHMPAFRALGSEQLRMLAEYLVGLR